MTRDKDSGANVPSDYEPSNSYWMALDKKYRIAHRYTRDIALARGQGTKLWDVEGKSYLDFEAGQVCVSSGHCHPHYTEVLQQQAARLVQTGSSYTDPTQILLVKKLAEISGPPYQKSYLACTGSEANEAAIRIAKAYTGRFEIVSFVGNYHGMTMGSWAVTGYGGYFREPYGAGPAGVTFLPTPYCYPAPKRPRFPHKDPEVVAACIEFCEMMLDETTSGRPAAIMLELIQSAAGVRMLPVEFVRAMRRICDERGALLIVDEAQTGMGRLGRWWGSELYDIKPDILVASKTLGGGVPLSGVITTAEIADKAVERGYRQSSSHTGDPLLCATGLANIEIIEREGLIANVSREGDYLKSELEKIAAESPIIGEIRGTGFLLGIEVVRSKEKGEPNGEGIEAITNHCRDNGLLTGWWPAKHLAANIIRLMPPFNLAHGEAEEAIAIIRNAVRAAGSTGAKRPTLQSVG